MNQHINLMLSNSSIGRIRIYQCRIKNLFWISRTPIDISILNKPLEKEISEKDRAKSKPKKAKIQYI